MNRASAELAGVASRLRGMSKAWSLETRTILRDVVKQSAVPAVQAAARAQLPKSGTPIPLNEWVADQPIKVSVGLGTRVQYVQMRAPSMDAAQTNSGWVHHPTFGHRQRGMWQIQRIPLAEGWWTKPLERMDPVVTAALIAAMREMRVAIQRAR